MTKIYVMESCPDCIEVKQRYNDNPEYELVDIGRQSPGICKGTGKKQHRHPLFRQGRWNGDHFIEEI